MHKSWKTLHVSIEISFDLCAMVIKVNDILIYQTDAYSSVKKSWVLIFAKDIIFIEK